MFCDDNSLPQVLPLLHILDCHEPGLSVTKHVQECLAGAICDQRRVVIKLADRLVGGNGNV